MQLIVVARDLLRALHQHLQFGGEAAAVADDAQAHAALAQFVDVVFEKPPHQLQQQIDLALRPIEILGRQRKDRQVAHAEIGATLCNRTDVARTGAMAGGARQMARFCPPVVAVHDDGHMARHGVVSRSGRRWFEARTCRS